MPGEYADLLNCSYGAADFQLADYTVDEKAQIKPGTGRAGTIVSLQGEGYVQGTSPEDFADKLAALNAAMRIDGLPLVVTGLAGEVEFVLLPPASIDGGPFVESFKILKGGDEQPLVKRFNFTIATQIDDTEEDDEKRNTYVVKTARRQADELRQISYIGTIRGVRAEEYFSGVALPKFRTGYPARSWVPSHEITRNLVDNLLEYTVTFTELATPLPLGAAAGRILDGEGTRNVEIDEHSQVTETYDFDFVVEGDPLAVLPTIRPPGVIYRERAATTQHKSLSLKATFVVISSLDGTGLLDWDNTVEFQEESNPRLPFEYIGRGPDFGQQAPVYRATQTGRCVGVGVFFKAAPSFFDAKYHASPPRIRVKALDRVKCETTWVYEFVSDTSLAVTKAGLASLIRPTRPEVYGG